MRHQPHDRTLAALGQPDIALDMDQAPQARGRGPPEQAALDDAAAKPAEVVAREAFALGLAHLRQAQREVAQCDAPTRAGQPVQQRADAAADARLHAERQPVQQPQHAQQQTGAQRGSLFLCAAQSAPGAARGCL